MLFHLIMNETNKLINDKSNPSKESFIKEYLNEEIVLFDLYPIKKLTFYRIKLGFFFIILVHLIFQVIDYYEFEWENKNMCMEKDPIWMFDERIELGRDYICKSENSTHFCYRNTIENYQSNKGVICKMKNFTLDPSKWQSDESKFKGPIDYKQKGFPLISKGLFNMMCGIENKINDVNNMYDFYFNSWNYTINDTKNIRQEPKYDELLDPEKWVFFISRNLDSPNLFHGGSGFLNAFAIMKAFYINPEDIQIVFLESVNMTDDPFNELYKELISRAADPVHISNLTKKYHITNAIHIPLNWDSPTFIFSNIPKCRKTTKTYDLLNKDIKEYMELKKFKDSIGYSKDIFYYPKTIINPNSKIYKKYVTIQWRKVWPKGRTGQQRIMGNGPELAEALAEKLPKNILIRLVDTAQLSMREQIMIMKKTDFFIAEHGSGLFLSIFLPGKAIVQEIMHKDGMNVLQLMSSLSGHETYSDIIKTRVEMIESNEVLFFDVKQFIKVVLTHMKKNNFYE